MRILFCGRTFPEAGERLRHLLPEEEIFACSEDEVARLGVDADVIIPLMHRLERELIDRTRAKLIHQWGVGLEGVDVAAATARGIMVCNVPADATANAHSTAEHAVFLMLAVARRIHECFRAFREGAWGSPMGDSLMGGTALIVGLGKVGRVLAQKLIALGMEVKAIRLLTKSHADRHFHHTFRNRHLHELNLSNVPLYPALYCSERNRTEIY